MCVGDLLYFVAPGIQFDPKQANYFTRYLLIEFLISILCEETILRTFSKKKALTLI
jgi:hypothetical protein